MATESQPADEQRRKLYESQSLKYQDGAHAAIQEFDRAILTLSAGTLGVSLAFIKDIVPLSQAIHLLLLFGSWAFLGASILLTLVSFVASQKAFKHSQKIAYQYYMEQKYEILECRHVPALVTRYLTYAAGGCFLVALVMTLVFATANVNNLSAILKTTKSKSGVPMSNMSLPNNTGGDVNKGVEPAGLMKVPAPQPLVVPPAPGHQSPVPPPTERK